MSGAIASETKPKSSLSHGWLSLGLGSLALLFSSLAFGEAEEAETDPMCDDLLNYEHRLLASKQSLRLCDAFQNEVILVVNTASQCGFTGQFEGLEALYQAHKDKGFVVLGFPSNDFRQEHEDESETADVCQLNYGVTFPMFATSSVRGAGANPLFSKLAQATQSPSWNFNKYLIGRDGVVIEHFGSMTKPLGGTLEARVLEALSQTGPNS
ncbi:MAG TPA: glutathione peroxidase [Wenzhouxiangella sp.]